ncbi:MAG: hypothetical protein WCW26_05290, partial [Candidatus Buchananbacteria bacterium]
MFFFSTIFGLPIKDSQNKIGGKVGDIVIKIDKDSETPEVAGVVVKKNLKKIGFVPTTDILFWKPKVIELKKPLADSMTEMPKADNLIYLYTTILDRQIV